jgi:hypothetical protein
MPYYRHIVSDIVSGVSREVDNSNPTLSLEEIASLGFDTFDLDVVDKDITADIEQQIQQEREALKEEALKEAWAFITPYFDDAAFIQIANWTSLPVDHEMHPYLRAIMTWKDAIMFDYLLITKPSILAGLPYSADYSFVGSPPCRFTDLFLMANPALKAYVPNWVAPDITNYQPGSRQNPKEIAF